MNSGDTYSPWDSVKLADILHRVRKPVQIEPDMLYREIGIRSHGKGLFYKEERTGRSLGGKSVFWVEPDCFVVNIVFAWEQAVAKTTQNELGMIASHRFPMYRPIADKLDLDYLLYFFNSPRGKYLLGLASPGGAGRNKTLGQKGFLDLSIPLPSLSEQKTIVGVLNTWDKTIALTEQLIAAKQKRKKGLMQQLLTGRSRFREFVQSEERRETGFGQIPCDWEVAHIEDVASVNTENLDEQTDPNAEFIYIDLSSVDQGVMAFPNKGRKFAELPSRARRLLHQGDVIMSLVRPNLLGFAVCDFEPERVLCSTGFALISPKRLSDSGFIYQSLYSDTIMRQVQELVTGSSFPAINSSDVQHLNLLWPKSSDERGKIGTALKICDTEINLLMQKLAALKQQKKGLMQQLLTGRIRMTV